MATLNFRLREKTKKHSGVRPIDVRADALQVVPLLELVFHQNLRGRASNALGPAMTFRLPWQPAPVVPGFVYEKDGDIAGNVSLMVTKDPNRYLVANVAVHPDQRRQGIARKMMNAVIHYVHQRRGHKIVLQVEEKNNAAADLYRSLGFNEIGTVIQWQAGYGALQSHIPVGVPVSARRPDTYEAFMLRPLRNDVAHGAYQLDISTHSAEMNWPDTPSLNYYRQGLSQWWETLVEGRHREIWLAMTHQKEVIGIGAIESDWGRPYVLRIRIHPEWRELVARPLVAKLIRRLHYMSTRPVNAVHIKDDQIVSRLLDEAGFRPQRTLVTMCLNFKK